MEYHYSNTILRISKFMNNDFCEQQIWTVLGSIFKVSYSFLQHIICATEVIIWWWISILSVVCLRYLNSWILRSIKYSKKNTCQNMDHSRSFKGVLRNSYLGSKSRFNQISSKVIENSRFRCFSSIFTCCSIQNGSKNEPKWS